jgi:molybdenum-dependent oxidoreductase-like protein
MDHMPALYYQTHYFVDGTSPEDSRKTMLTAMGVKTLIKYPRDEDSPLSRGAHAVRGLAWSGQGRIVRVEASTDGGASWHDAHLEESYDRWLWVRWSYVWEANEAGEYRIMARATDERGRVQPQIRSNFQRKHFDGIVPETVTIV